VPDDSKPGPGCAEARRAAHVGAARHLWYAVAAMNRRAFLGGLGAGVFTAPAAAWPQSRAPVIGYLSARSLEDTGDLVMAFRRGLADRGLAEGRNLVIVYRWARGQYDRLPALARELVGRPVTVLVTTGGESAALAARAATSTIPIVCILGSDPVKVGLVASYGRPGGNVTGITIMAPSLEGKRVQLLRELLPKAVTIGFLLNASNPPAESQLRGAQDAGRALGLQVRALRAGTDGQIEAAFSEAARQRLAGLVVASGPFFDTRYQKIVALAAQHALPTIYHARGFVDAGGLLSYGTDFLEASRQAGVYAARIVEGARPADLPVIGATKFELVINAKAARALALTIPPSLLLQADRVIE
jgi:putative tryptophan/tyrosine transport system substrate-binding protein